MNVEQRKALQSIIQCRTPVMGGRSYRCLHCQKDHFAWHSCNHRLCPRCGSTGTAEWVADKLESRLPVDHYMVTFTLPSELRKLCRYNSRDFLRLFFACSAQAIKDVLKEKRHLGGEAGFVGTLQTWTQDLRLHPHIHYIVPAVAIDASGKVRRPKRKGWLARGEVLASRLRTLLLRAIANEKLLPPREVSMLWKIKWNCDVENFGNGVNAFKYLGGYVCKGPIPEKRMLGVNSGIVSISVKDRENDKTKVARIEAVEFVRRYLQHALPTGFHAIRYHGFLHPRSKAKLASIRKQLGARLQPRTPRPDPTPQAMQCPRCRKPMELTSQLSRAPPWERTIPEIWLRRNKVA